MMESRLRRRQQLTFWTLLALLIATLVVSIGIGPASLSYDRLLPTLLGNGSFKEEFVLYSLRLPRLLITVMAGMALALSGAILQGITRNELADPGIIGINTGAGVAVALFFLYFPTDVGSFIYLLPIAAFLGALVTATAIYLFSYDRVQGLQPIRLILTGVGFSMALSGIMVILISSTRREKVDFIAKWLAGNIWGTDWIFVYSLLPWLLVLIPLTFYKANKLNLLALNEPVAIGVGVAIEKERIQLLLTAVALAAAAVSVTGGISFIGLMAPHIAHRAGFEKPGSRLLASAVIGSVLMVIADLGARTATFPYELPLGLFAAFAGAPYLVWTIGRR